MSKRINATSGLLLGLAGMMAGCGAMGAEASAWEIELEVGEESSVDAVAAAEAVDVGDAADADVDGSSDSGRSNWATATSEAPALPLVDMDARQLAQQWLRWSLAQPWSTGPVNDTTGAGCRWGQQDALWFLAGTAGGSVVRECEIPAGTELFFPLLNGWAALPLDWLAPGDPLDEVMPELLATLEDQHVHTCALTLHVDGQEVAGSFAQMHEDLLVEIVEPFEIDMNIDDPASELPEAGGPMSAVTAGYYARLAPLLPGEHVLEFGGSVCSGATGAFQTSVTYTVHVAG